MPRAIPGLYRWRWLELAFDALVVAVVLYLAYMTRVGPDVISAFLLVFAPVALTDRLVSDTDLLPGGSAAFVFAVVGIGVPAIVFFTYPAIGALAISAVVVPLAFAGWVTVSLRLPSDRNRVEKNRWIRHTPDLRIALAATVAEVGRIDKKLVEAREKTSRDRRTGMKSEPDPMVGKLRVERYEVQTRWRNRLAEGSQEIS